MLDRQLIEQTALRAIEGTDMFLVDLRIEPDNRIVVELDSASVMDLDQCADVSRAIEDALDRDAEDYELEVGSAGLTSPFKVRGQYLKNVGNEVEVLTRDGRKLTGTLTDVADDNFTLTTTVKVKEPGKKRPVLVEQPLQFGFDQVKQVKYLINFK